MPKFLAVIIGINIIGLLPAYIADNSSAWMAYAAVTQATCALYCLGWSCEVPYSAPIKKSLLVVQGCVELAHLVFMLPVFSAMAKQSLLYVYAVGVAVGCIFATNVSMRWYSRPTENLDDSGLFEVWRRPESPLSLFLSWFSCGGGKSIYADGKWYHFHSDTLREYKREELQRRIDKGQFFAIRKRNTSHKDKIKLKSLVGTKWSILNNCLSVFNRKEF